MASLKDAVDCRGSSQARASSLSAAVAGGEVGVPVLCPSTNTKDPSLERKTACHERASLKVGMHIVRCVVQDVVSEWAGR